LIVSFLLFVVACSSNSKKDADVDSNVTDNDTDEAKSDEDTEEKDEDEQDDEDSDQEGEETEVEPLDCANLVDGLNENLIAGEGANELERSFILRLPKDIDSDKKFPVVFLYHGVGDTADGIEPLLKPYVDNETMPFILVVPESRNDIFGFESMPPSGMDWDMMNLTDASAEADMFDAVLACLDEKWGFDEQHIHVTGFSAGAITANSIALQRPEKVASVLSYSGAYFSDEKSRDALGDIMGMLKVGDFFSWPDFAEEHTKYPQVFVFGDKEEDSWDLGGIFTIYFNTMGRLGASYLTENGHDAILCEHEEDHTVAGISPENMIKFFADHPFGTEKSSYREEMPEAFSEICHFFTEEDLDGIDTGDSDSGDSDSGDSDSGDADVTLACSDFKEGLNQNLAAGKGENMLKREFYLHLPQNVDTEGKKLPVIFFYHPYTGGDVDDVLAQTDAALSQLVNNNDMPFILVLPKARNDKFYFGTTPTGLDWDIMNLDDGSAEADMFDAVMKCLEQRWKIDADHIHLAGYSAGAIAANSVALKKSEKIASVLTYSGAYFSNADNRTALGFIEIGSGQQMAIGDFFKWPDFEDNHNKYTQMFVFGAEGQDTWTPEGSSIITFTVDFNQMAHNDGRYLQENGHGAILCNHGGGHQIQLDEQDAAVLIKFFKDHPITAQPSPYAEDMPQIFMDSDCVFQH